MSLDIKVKKWKEPPALVMTFLAEQRNKAKVCTDAVTCFSGQKKAADATKMERARASLIDVGITVPRTFHLLFFQEKAMDLLRFSLFDEFAELVSPTGGYHWESMEEKLSEDEYNDLVLEVIGLAASDTCAPVLWQVAIRRAVQMTSLATCNRKLETRRTRALCNRKRDTRRTCGQCNRERGTRVTRAQCNRKRETRRKRAVCKRKHETRLMRASCERKRETHWTNEVKARNTDQAQPESRTTTCTPKAAMQLRGSLRSLATACST